MAITGQVAAVVKQFQKDNPKAGTPTLSKGGGERSVDEQMEIILQPKRKNNYLNIKGRFLKEFKLKALPAYAELTPEQKKWWTAGIKQQAGKPNGFPHVGGKAQDVAIKGLAKEDRETLKKAFETKGYGVLNENVTNDKSDYNVSIDKATVFHVYKK